MRAFLLTAGIVFAFLATAQLLRLIFALPVVVGGVSVPVWVSAFPLLILSLLAIWAFRLSRGTPAR